MSKSTTTSDDVTLEIGGTVFKTKLSTLKSIPNSRLSELDVASSDYDKETHMFKFDRDAGSFKSILNAYRDKQLHIPRDMCPQQFQKELEFWEISIKLLAPCCWKTFYETKKDIGILDMLLSRVKRFQLVNNKVGAHDTVQSTEQTDSGNKDDPATWADKQQQACKQQTPVRDNTVTLNATFCNRLWLFLEEPTSSMAAKVWLFVYMAVVIISVITTLLWSIPELRVDPYLNPPTNESYFDWDQMAVGYIMQEWEMSLHVILIVFSDVHPAIFSIDLACMAFFVLETVIHFCACPMKKLYPKDPYCCIKVFLVITMIISLSLELNREYIDNDMKGKFYTVSKSFSVARLLLIFRARKLYKALDILLLSIENSLRELALLAFAFSICVIIYGAMMFSAEIETNTFSNVGKAMWWALITMTTVGYGDFFPTTRFGYFIASFCAIQGLIVLALPVAAIASTFSSFYSKNADIEKHEETIQEEEERMRDRAIIM